MSSLQVLEICQMTQDWEPLDTTTTSSVEEGKMSLK